MVVRTSRRRRERLMGIDDQVRDKLEEIKGRAKEAAGAATDNDSLKEI